MTNASPVEEGTASPVPIDRRRYARVAAFFWATMAHLLFWDVAVRRFVPGGWASRTADRRWRELARRFRALAVSQGGVLIKLGQFLSIRVDVLPASVTQELAGLQDEVPPAPFDAVLATIEAAFGVPTDQLFETVEPGPLGAASLAQAHRARLGSGEPVVIKVQRPGITTLVETDLAAIRMAMRFLRRFSWVRRRVDLEQLYAEFARTTRAELDFVAEGRNTERFAKDFAGERLVRVPSVHWDRTRTTVLTLEDVSGIKITDEAALAAAGVDPRTVAAKVVDLYFEQIFVSGFVHADPHPGNLFVIPDGPVRPEGGTRFRIAFVDFGMMATVPERVREHLREYLIGLATRDAARIVRAYDGAGVLLPTADRRRIEQAQAEILNRFWGVRIGDMQTLAVAEGRALAREFADLLREMPFQLPADLLFIGRSVGMVSGLAVRLDPDFDLWSAVAPYARRLAAGGAATEARGERGFLEGRIDELEAQLKGLLGVAGLLGSPARSLAVIPGELERVLAQVASGQLVLQHDLAPELRRDVERFAQLGGRLVWAIALAAALLAAAVIRVAEGPSLLSNAILVVAGAGLVYLFVSRG